MSKDQKKGRGEFLAMSNDPDVHIDDVVHKTVLEVPFANYCVGVSVSPPSASPLLQKARLSLLVQAVCLPFPSRSLKRVQWQQLPRQS